MGTRTIACVTLLAALACSAGLRLPKAAKGDLALEIGGDVRGGPFRLGEPDLAALPQRKLEGVNPAAGRQATYEGLDLARLEEGLELTKGADTLVVRSADRRSAAIPLSVVRQLRPVLALRADGANLPARELAWPNVEHFGVGTDARAPLWWMGRVVKLELVAWAEVYGRALRLPPGAPAGALSGARTYASRCIGCHGVRGAGGAFGPDLSKGGGWAQEEKLRAVLAAHPGWAGPGLSTPDAARIPELSAFLRALAIAGPDDADEADGPAAPEPVPPLTPLAPGP